MAIHVTTNALPSMMDHNPATTLWVFGSHRAMNDAIQRTMTESHQSVIMGGNTLTMRDLVTRLANTPSAPMDELLSFWLTWQASQQSTFKYFDAMKNWPIIIHDMHAMLMHIKKCGITPKALEDMLHKGGGDKEFDLLTLYRTRENDRLAHQWIDDADIWHTAIHNSDLADALAGITTIHFDASHVWHPEEAALIRAIDAQCPDCTLQIHTIPGWQPPRLNTWMGNQSECDMNIPAPPTTWSALATPGQEVCWVANHIQEAIAMGTPADRIGILLRRDSTIQIALLKQLRTLGIGDSIICDTQPLMDCLSHEIMQQIHRHQDSTITLDTALDLIDNTVHTHLDAHPLTGVPLDEGPIATTNSVIQWQTLSQQLRFAHNALGGHPFEKAPFMEWLSMAYSKYITPTHVGITPIQWYTFDDIPTIDCDILFIPECTHTHYPRSFAASLFFTDWDRYNNPYHDQLLQFRQTPEDTFHFEWALFHSCMMGAKDKIILSMPAYSDMGSELSPSPFTLTLGDPSYEANAIASSAIHDDDLNERASIEKEHKLDTIQTPTHHALFTDTALLPAIREKLDARTFSVSQFKEYATCPFTFFAHRLLGIPGDEDTPPEGKPKDRGKIVHAALENMLRDHRDTLIAAITSKEKRQALLDATPTYVDKAIKAHRDDIAYMNDAMVRYMRTYFISTVSLLITTEIDILSGLPHHIVPTEFELKFGLGSKTPPLIISHAELKKDIRVQGIIDRLDIDKDNNQIVIYDYKSGRTTSVVTDIKKGLHYQLPIYRLAIERVFTDYTVAGAFLISLKMNNRSHGLAKKSWNNKLFFVGARSSSLLDDDAWEDLHTQAFEQLTKDISTMYAGHFEACPRDCKSYCGWRDICRYEHRALT